MGGLDNVAEKLGLSLSRLGSLSGKEDVGVFSTLYFSALHIYGITRVVDIQFDRHYLYHYVYH